MLINKQKNKNIFLAVIYNKVRVEKSFLIRKEK